MNRSQRSTRGPSSSARQGQLPHMAGGAELAALKHELAQVRGVETEGLPEASELSAPLPQLEKGSHA